MKRNMIRIGGLAILAASAAFTWTFAQDAFAPLPNPGASNPGRPYDEADIFAPAGTSPNYARNTYASNSTYRMPPNPQQIKISQLREQVLQTDDEEQREEKLAVLQTLLEKSFDEGMKAQGDELAKLENRVAALKKAFERRKTNRDRVISNYVDSVRLQAEGLTIPALGNVAPRRQNTSPYRDLPGSQPFGNRPQLDTEPAPDLPQLVPADAPDDGVFDDSDNIFADSNDEPELPSLDDSNEDGGLFE